VLGVALLILGVAVGDFVVAGAVMRYWNGSWDEPSHLVPAFLVGGVVILIGLFLSRLVCAERPFNAPWWYYFGAFWTGIIPAFLFLLGWYVLDEYGNSRAI
jgi:uncharacterized membrane protein YjjP (DUF1212 family)